MTRRPSPQVPRATLGALAAFGTLRAAALLLIAEGFAGLVVADAGARLAAAAAFAVAGLLLRAGAGWGTGVVARRAAAAAKLGHRAELGRAVVDRDLAAGSVALVATRGLDGLDAFYASVVPAMIASVVVPLGLGLRVLTVDPLSAVVLAATLPLVPVFMILIGLHSRDRVEHVQTRLALLADHVAELAHGLPVLVGLGRDREQADRLDAVQRSHTTGARRVLRTAFLSALALELLATLSVAVVAVLLGVRLVAGQADLGDALIVLLLAPECFTVLRELGAAHHAAEDGRAALERIRELLRGGARRDARRRAGVGAAARGLSVSYPDRSRLAVSSVDLEVRPGEVVALTGASGSGKSTVLAALAGVLPADARVEGTLRVAAATAWVPQDPAFAGPTARAELVRIAGDDDVDGVLAELGLDAIAAADPATLSPGEGRRLAVARALLRVDRGAGLLLLDEPTAHLDADSAARVRAALGRRRGAAVLLVSHDPATLALADRRVALDTAIPRAASEEARPTVRPSTPARGRAVPATPLDRRTAVRVLAGPRPARWLGAILLGVLAAGMGLALTAVSGWLIVRAADRPAIMYLMVAIVGVRFFGLGRAVARYGERLVTHAAAFESADALRLRLWAGIAARGAGSRDLAEGGRAVDRLLGTAGEIRDLLPRVVVPVAVAALTVLGVTGVVLLLAPPAAPVVAAGLLLALLGSGALAIATGRRAEVARVRTGSDLLRAFASVGTAAPDLRANGAADRAVAELDRVAADVARAERRSARAADLGVLGAPLVAGVAAVVAALVLAGSGSPATTLATVALLVLAAGEPIAAGVAGLHRIPALADAVRALGALLVPAQRGPRGSGEVATVRELELDGLAIGQPSGVPVAEGLTARASRGRWLAVTGPSGAGKTTLLTTVLGGLDPLAGRIRIDGRELSSLDPAQWRGRVAWCPQEAHVFDSTVRGNLTIARPRADAVTEGEMRDVLRRVGLDAVVAEMTDGLDGRLGSHGRALSGGERQRLAVARALLSRADIVLLDEPTAHLDEPGAEALMADLRAALADRIVLLVSHRDGDRREGDALLELGDAEPVPAPLAA